MKNRIYGKKKTLFTVARQTDYTFRQLWGKVMFGGMYPIGQILNYDERREFQNRWTEYMHPLIHACC